MEFNNEIYSFDLEKFDNQMDKDNAILEYLVNRAIYFCKDRDYIVVENLNDKDESKVMMKILGIVSDFTGISIFLYEKLFRKKTYKNLTRNIHYVSKRKFNSIKNNGFIFCPCTNETTNYYLDKYNHIDNFIFEGIEQEVIARIAKTLI